MTHQEVKALANGRAIPPWIMKLVSDAIAIEVAREREACAGLCDFNARMNVSSLGIAEAIRARGTNE